MRSVAEYSAADSTKISITALYELVLTPILLAARCTRRMRKVMRRVVARLVEIERAKYALLRVTNCLVFWTTM